MTGAEAATGVRGRRWFRDELAGGGDAHWPAPGGHETAVSEPIVDQ